MNNKEIIPSPVAGCPYSHDLAQVDNYVTHHIGIEPTKMQSEVRRDAPPPQLAMTMQRIMARDHSHVYGMFKIDTLALGEYTQEEFIRVITQYQDDIQLIPAEYGAIPGATLQDYFKVTTTAFYEYIAENALLDLEEGSITSIVIDLIEVYRLKLSIEPWEAARNAVALLNKAIPMINDIYLRRVDMFKTKRAASHDAIQTFRQSSLYQAHIAYLEREIQNGKAPSAIFNDSIKVFDDYKARSHVSEPCIYFGERDFTAFCEAYHIMERPYSMDELAKTQQLLDTDVHLKQAMILTHIFLLDYISHYFTEHPERFAHSLEFFTELFLTAQDESGAIRLIPNPKLLKIISKNVLPAVIRTWAESGDDALSGQTISEGALRAKRLKIFQTMIGEFHQSTDTDGASIVSLDSFIAQTCPAMNPITDVLVGALPVIYDSVKAKQLKLEL